MTRREMMAVNIFISLLRMKRDELAWGKRDFWKAILPFRNLIRHFSSENKQGDGKPRSRTGVVSP